MTKLDLKKEHRGLFNPPKDIFVEVLVPAMPFVKADGVGDPIAPLATRRRSNGCTVSAMR